MIVLASAVDVSRDPDIDLECGLLRNSLDDGQVGFLDPVCLEVILQ